ncbi:extensin-like [Orussus abietinus]|uniref:extensin-like n=1 Tax=Orussus abietinus TaxID=222816 RepID=UPI0006252EE9|nr:extensin-like [Orussus abietinus]
MCAMTRFKVAATVLVAILCTSAWRPAGAVVNEAPLKSEKDGAVKKDGDARDKIGDSYGPPFSTDDLVSVANGSPPVYGPPEKTGDVRPPPIYPPPPPDVPPPVYGPPAATYGPPRKPKPWYGPPKRFHGSPPLKTSYGPPKIRYGPPSLPFGPPKPQYGPPKPQYGPPPPLPPPPPPVFALQPQTQYGLPKVIKPGHGPPIPLSLEAYGPPLDGLVASFDAKPQDDYGPPPPPPHGIAPQHQYGPPPPRHQYGPPPPPPGVPAPPTPPDIKYDGWQPIAGLVGTPDGHDTSSKSNIPSDSYGVPIHNPEAQHLKSSVHQSSSDDNNGLPPPLLPQFEPLHDNYASSGDQHAGHNKPTAQYGPPDDQYGIPDNKYGPLDSNYGPPSGESLSIVKTVGFELAPEVGGSHHGGSLDGGAVALDLGAGAISGGSALGGHGSLGELDLPPPPPPTDSYGAPPLSSFAFNGPYPPSQGPRGGSKYSSASFGLGFFGGDFGGHHRSPQRHPLRSGPRGPPLLPESLIPPKNRAPIKFKESVPAGLLFSVNRYLPPVPVTAPGPPSKNYGPPPSYEQRLPALGAAVPFRNSHSFSGSGHFGHGLGAALAAPNVNYGTPLSFTDFNAPAPTLTYGAPNFGPIGGFVNTAGLGTGNLYDGLHGNALTTTYGAPLSTDPIHDCGFQKGGAPELTAFSLPALDFSTSGIIPYDTPIHHPVSNFLTASLGNSINELDLQVHEQSKTDLKDSYGNPVGITYEHPHQEVQSHSEDSGYADDGSSRSHEEAQSAEAATAALTEQAFSRNSLHEAAETAPAPQALPLTQNHNHEANDGFQIQGSKGIYTLQIQAADGGFGTENSDGSIRHEQLLSDGLLQDILAAIEQPQRAGSLQPISTNALYGPDLSGSASIQSPSISKPEKTSPTDQFSSNETKDIMERMALFFDNRDHHKSVHRSEPSKNNHQPDNKPA